MYLRLRAIKNKTRAHVTYICREFASVCTVKQGQSQSHQKQGASTTARTVDVVVVIDFGVVGVSALPVGEEGAHRLHTFDAVETLEDLCGMIRAKQILQPHSQLN